MKNKLHIWMSQAIQKVQDLVRSMWFERNQQLHNNEKSQHNKQREEKNDTRI